MNAYNALPPLTQKSAAVAFSLPQIFGMAPMGESLIDIRESDINNTAAREIAKSIVHRDAISRTIQKNMFPARSCEIEEWRGNLRGRLSPKASQATQ